MGGQVTEQHQHFRNKVYIIYLMLLEKQHMFQVIAKTSKDTFPITVSEASATKPNHYLWY